MTYCKPGWTENDMPIRSISVEEYNKNLDVFPTPNIFDNIGTGKLTTYASSPWGSYSYYVHENFIYLMYQSYCFKIRHDQKEKVADKLIRLAESLKKL